MPEYTTSTANIRRRFALRPAESIRPRPKRPPSRLLALPAELRDAIYDCALSDLHASPEDGDLTFKTTFTTYRSLRRVNRLVGNEVKRVFATCYAPTLEIYTRSLLQVHRIAKAAKTGSPELGDARYRLVYDPQDGGDEMLLRVMYQGGLLRGRRGEVAVWTGRVGDR